MRQMGTAAQSPRRTGPAGGDGGDRFGAEQPHWLTPSTPVTGELPELPETVGYRIKRALLGRPLESSALHSERLGKPTALAVLSSDVISSSAYGTESILRVLIPVAGLGAFALITPITGLLLIVLVAVCLCYRNVVKAYPVAGGSYVVSRENFGYSVAQIPGAALLCSYTLTVAVSIAAGVDAVISAFPAIGVSPVVLSILFVLLLTYGNLRGIKEAGRLFAIPTYWFICSMAALIVVAVVRVAISGHLAHAAHSAGQLHAGPAGAGLLLGASVFIFLRGFANGGSAMTGMEAISNAVSVFKDPQIRNARQTLVLMASIIGGLFLAVSVFAALTHAIPFLDGTPTVLSEIGTVIFGAGAIGRVAFYSLQFSTALILILGANTSFNGFPLLMNFIARDSFMPRPLTRRGHRLVYSNGIIFLAVLSIALLLVTRANVASLIPLYATTVFTGFTMAGAGMFVYHYKRRLPDRRHGLAVNGIAAATSGIVTLIFVITEFTRGAWAVVVVIPLIIYALSRTHRRYEAERAILAAEAPRGAGGKGARAAAKPGAGADEQAGDRAADRAGGEAPARPAGRAMGRAMGRETREVRGEGRSRPLGRLEVIVLVDRADLATSRALDLATMLASGSPVRAVHFSDTEERSDRLFRAWTRLDWGDTPLQIIECPDRRVTRAVRELAQDLADDGNTEVLLILPRRAFRGVFSRLMHDHTAERIVGAVTTLEHVSATIAPFDVERLLKEGAGRDAALAASTVSAVNTPGASSTPSAPGTMVGAGAGGGGGTPPEERALDDQRAPESSAPKNAGTTQEGSELAKELDAYPSPVGAAAIGSVTHRQRARVAGRVRSVSVQPWSGVPTFECMLVDPTGAIVLAFLGRREIAGIVPGAKLVAEGAVGGRGGQLAMLNPTWELLEPVEPVDPSVASGAEDGPTGE